jgi:hypothetical protein
VQWQQCVQVAGWWSILQAAGAVSQLLIVAGCDHSHRFSMLPRRSGRGKSMTSWYQMCVHSVLLCSCCTSCTCHPPHNTHCRRREHQPWLAAAGIVWLR